MDPTLAEIYGTNQTADIQKLAAAELAENLAGEEGAENIDDMSPEQIEALAEQVLASSTGDETPTEGEQAAAEEPEQETMDKLSEADYLGRVMAHSFKQELGLIDEAEKTAGVKETARAAGGKVMSHLKNLGSKAKGMAGKASTHAQRAGETLKAGVTGHYGSGAYSKGMAGGHHLSGKQRAKILGKAGAGVAAAGAVGYGAKKALEKKSSALDTLAEQRAIEILEANGIDPATLEAAQAPQGQEKVSSADVLGTAVEGRAWEILGQFGFTPEE